MNGQYDKDEPLDAYGHLNWTVGWSDEWNEDTGAVDDEGNSVGVGNRGDWLVCVDYAVSIDRKWVCYHVIVNSDSGGFIDTVEQGEYSIETAREALPCLLEYWRDIGSEHLVGSGHWFTPQEIEDDLKSIASWKAALEKDLAP